MNRNDGAETAAGDVLIFGRERAELTGILDVSGFTDDNITLSCAVSEISIEGNGLRIDSFDSSTGNLTIHGRIDGVFYYGGTEKNKKGKFSKLFG